MNEEMMKYGANAVGIIGTAENNPPVLSPLQSNGLMWIRNAGRKWCHDDEADAA
jgi:hypothetical protein